MSSPRILRGGCYRTPYNTQSTSRSYGQPDDCGYGLGFRLVREPKSHGTLRGGSWINNPVSSRFANRVNIVSSIQSIYLGFRLVKEPK